MSHYGTFVTRFLSIGGTDQALGEKDLHEQGSPGWDVLGAKEKPRAQRYGILVHPRKVFRLQGE